jgi:hypothetical protein
MVSPWPDRAFRAAAPPPGPPPFLAFRLGRACPGHPRLSCHRCHKTWMPGTRPGHDELETRSLPESDSREAKPNSFRQPQLHDLAARCARVLIQRPALLDQRARGMPGADAPAAARGVVVARALVTAGGTGITRHSPRNGFNGLLRALPGDRAFLPPSPAKIAFCRLDASVGASGPHDFAVRRRHRPSSAPPASTASRPYVRDVAQRPLRVGRDPIAIVLIWVRGQEKFGKSEIIVEVWP